MDAPAAVLKGTSLAAEVRVAQRGLGGPKVQLVVEDGGRIVQSQEVELPADGESGGARVHLTASEAGPARLPLPRRRPPGEQVGRTTSRTCWSRSRTGAEKILYFEGEPRFELKFLRRAVDGDQNLQLVCLQRTSQNKFLRLDVDDAEELAGGLPDDARGAVPLPRASCWAASRRASSPRTSSA